MFPHFSRAIQNKYLFLYEFCFRVMEKVLDMFKGYIQPWEDIDHFEQILRRYCLDNTLLGLKYFFVKNVCCYFYLFCFFKYDIHNCCGKLNTPHLFNFDSWLSFLSLKLDRERDPRLEYGLHVWLSVFEWLQSCDDQQVCGTSRQLSSQTWDGGGLSAERSHARRGIKGQKHEHVVHWANPKFVWRFVTCFTWFSK